jgi:hypothetical protein
VRVVVTVGVEIRRWQGGQSSFEFIGAVWWFNALHVWMRCTVWRGRNDDLTMPAGSHGIFQRFMVQANGANARLEKPLKHVQPLFDGSVALSPCIILLHGFVFFTCCTTIPSIYELVAAVTQLECVTYWGQALTCSLQRPSGQSTRIVTVRSRVRSGEIDTEASPRLGGGGHTSKGRDYHDAAGVPPLQVQSHPVRRHRVCRLPSR